MSALRRRSTRCICSGVPCDGSTTRVWPTRVSPTRGARWPAERSTSRPPARSTSTCRSASRLSARPGPLPPGRPLQPAIAVPPNGSGSVRLDAVRGVILAGGRGGVSGEAIAKLAETTAGPCWRIPHRRAATLDVAITAFDALLRHQPFVDAHRPELIVRIGRPAASKVLAQWVADCAGVRDDARAGRWPRRDRPRPPAWRRTSVTLVPSTAGPCAAAPDAAWQDGWMSANQRAEAAIDAVLDRVTALTEPSVARTVARHLPPDAQLVVASSMPVRDLEWFGGPAGQGTRQPRRQRHRRRGVDGTRRRTGRAAHDRPRRRHRLRPRRWRPDRPARHDEPTCASSSSTTTAVGSSRSCLKPTTSTGSASSSCSGRRTAPT